jgi:tetratricopeptide (TPR) repeat protein
MKVLRFDALMLAAALAAPASAQTSAEPPAAPALVAATATDASYSAAGLYNLANSYARAGRPGMAVLNYKRAALLAPNDADIQANLRYVSSSAHVPAEARGRFERLAHWASPTAVALAGLLGVLILGSSLLAAVLFPRRWVLWATASCLGLAAIGFSVCNAIFWRTKVHEAVVIAPNTQIRATPVPMGDPLQQLSEAETVTITAGHEDFVLVRAASGRAGWVARADLADVVPMSPPNSTQ